MVAIGRLRPPALEQLVLAAEHALTEPSVKIWRIELVSRSAQESTLTKSGAPGAAARCR